MKKLIKMFLQSSDQKLEIPVKYIQFYQNILEDLGYKQKDWETNGWDVDFWSYYRKGDVTICLSGSLYYGKYILTKI